MHSDVVIQVKQKPLNTLALYNRRECCDALEATRYKQNKLLRKFYKMDNNFVLTPLLQIPMLYSTSGVADKTENLATLAAPKFEFPYLEM